MKDICEPKPKVCPECGGKFLIWDASSEEMICERCGLMRAKYKMLKGERVKAVFGCSQTLRRKNKSLTRIRALITWVRETLDTSNPLRLLDGLILESKRRWGDDVMQGTHKNYAKYAYMTIMYIPKGT